MKMRHIMAAVLAWVALPLAAADSPAAVYSNALQHALQRRDAVALVVDVRTGRVLAAKNPERAARLLASPGSVLKPFYLQAALDAGIVQPMATVHCSRLLHIAGHTLNCGHPPEPDQLSASEALAYSCNTYFATLALHMDAQQLGATLHRYGIGEASHLLPDEVVDPIVLPRTTERRQLFVLGVSGLRVSVAQVATAYQRLALAHRRHEESAATAAVWQGLEDSVSYGTSNVTAISGFASAGKTGTAADPDYARTHGWFVGIAPADVPRVIVVIYLPNGNGGDAAQMARRFYLDTMPMLRGAESR